MHAWGRRLVLMGLLVLAGAGPGLADPPAKDKPNPRLKAVLAEWEKTTQSIRQLHYEFIRTEVDTTFNTKVASSGQVYFKKPDLFCMESRLPNGEIEYVLLADGKLQQYRARERRQMIILPIFWSEPMMIYYFHQLPIGQWEKDCDVTLRLEDENWICLEIKPRTQQQKADFERMEVVLNAKTFQVKRLFFEKSNSSSVTMDIEKTEINGKVPMTLESIRKGLPQGRKFEDVKAVPTQP